MDISKLKNTLNQSKLDQPSPEDKKYIIVFTTSAQAVQTLMQKLYPTVDTFILKPIKLHQNPEIAISELERLVSKYKGMSVTISGILIDTPTMINVFFPAEVEKGEAIKKNPANYYYSYRVLSQSKTPLVFAPPTGKMFWSKRDTLLTKRAFDKLLDTKRFTRDIGMEWEAVVTHPTVGNIEAIVALSSKSVFISYDIETMPYDKDITVIGFTFVYYDEHRREPVLHTYSVPMISKMHHELVRMVLETPVPKVAHNGMYDAEWCWRYNIKVGGYMGDTMYYWQLMFPELPRSLAFVSSFNMLEYTFHKDEAKARGMQYLKYNAKDCHNTALSFINILKIMGDYAVTNIGIQWNLIYPSMFMDLQGLPADEAKFELARLEFEKDIAELEGKLKTIFKGIKLPCTKGTIDKKTGKVKLLDVGVFNKQVPPAKKLAILATLNGGVAPKSTEEEEVQKIAGNSPLAFRVCELLLKHTKATKLYGTYIWSTKNDRSKLYKGKIFFNLNPFGTKTGRYGCRGSVFDIGFQVQNVPPIIRKLVKAVDGYSIKSVDFPQSESRTTAYLSDDANLIATVEDAKDFHCVNASLFFGLEYEDILSDPDKIIRKLAKRVNHGANYNMSWYVLLLTMGIENVLIAKKALKLPDKFTPASVCAFLLLTFERTYPDVKGRWYDELIDEVNNTGRLVTPDGWTRVTFLSPNRTKAGKKHLNEIVASKPQGMSVRVINKGLLKMWKEMQSKEFSLMAQVHDEIVAFVSTESKEVEDALGAKMMNSMQYKQTMGSGKVMYIPPDKPNTGTYWDEAHG